jgi:hypothetical protein
MLDQLIACDLAFLDSHDRLCVIGVTTRFLVASLPARIDRLMLVGRLVGLQPGDAMDVGVAIGTPGGLWRQPKDAGFRIEQAGEYLFITLSDVPLTEAGLHRFAVAMGDQELTLEIPVTVIAEPAAASIH